MAMKINSIRVFLNLIKNSEVIFWKIKKRPDFKGIINIDISDNKDYIVCRLIDNGPGITNEKKAMTHLLHYKKAEPALACL